MFLITFTHSKSKSFSLLQERESAVKFEKEKFLEVFHLEIHLYNFKIVFIELK